ncbi:MAG TPA: membrane dipeptidase, partial [Cyclobacteriaceae bacterium]|nr:membrane dipeptidase [Cyclobacteriaceae bacterium]
MKIHSLLLFCSALAIVSCSDKKSVSRMTDDELRTYANELAHKYIITDGHVDLPGALIDKKYFPTAENIDTIIHTGKGNFDYERAVKGGLTAPFMSIYIPSSRQALPDMGKSLADSMINMVHAISQLLPDKFALANTPAQVEANFKQGKISLPMGMENGAPIGNDLANLQHFFDRGIRYITLTHSRDNQICDSSGDTTKTWNGLSPFGKDVVAEMNRLGIMVDISHVDDSTFYQAVKLSKAPVIASHSSCRAFAPTVRRNMTDDMIKKLGEHGGVMQINFYSAFLDSAVSNANTKSRAELKKLLAEKGLQASDTAAQALIAQFEKEHPWKTTPIETVADHID